MIGHSSKIFIEALIGVFAGIVILLGIAFWRLTEGPVSVDFLDEQLEAAFNTDASELQIEVAETVIAWGGWDRNLELRARDWQVVGPDGGVVATLPEMRVRISVSALLNGTLAPTEIDLDGIEIELYRREDGSFGVTPRIDDEATETAEMELVAPVVLQQLLSERDPEVPLSYLRRVSITGATLTVRDETLGFSWTAPGTTVVLERAAPGLRASTSFDLRAEEGREEGQSAAIDAALLYDTDIGSLELVLSFSDLNPKSLARLSPKLEELRRIDMVAAGSVTGAMFPDGRIETVSIDLNSPGGTVMAPELYAEPMKLQDVALAATYTGAEKLLAVNDLSFTFDIGEDLGPSVATSANLQWSERGLGVSLETRATDIGVDDIPAIWPVDAPGNGRAWVQENVTAGKAVNAAIHASLSLPEMDPDKLLIQRLEGSYDYQDLTIHYLRPMPPITGINGSATFDAVQMVFSVNKGSVGEISSGPATVVLSGFEEEFQRADIDFAPSAPLGAVLGLLNHPRLRLIEDLGLDPATVTGHAAAEVTMGFPLDDELTFDGVDVVAEGTLSKVAIHDLLLDQEVTGGELALSLDKDGMKIEGDALFAEIPIEVLWTEAFADGQEFTTRLDVTAPRFEAAQLSRFGLETAEYLEGPLSAAAKVRERGDGSGEAEVSAQFNSARMAMPFLGWEKPAGAPGAVSAILLFDNSGLQAINGVDLSAGTFSARGTFSVDPQSQKVVAGSFSELRLDKTFLVNTTVRGYRDGVEINLGGGELDLSAYFEDDEKETQEDAASSEEEQEEPYTPLRVTGVQLDRVVMGEGRHFEAVDFELQRGPEGWEIIKFDGSVPRSLWRAGGTENAADAEVERRRFVFEFGPGVAAEQPGQYGLRFLADDAGSVLRALDWADTIEGGQLEVRGVSPAPLPKGPLTASVEAVNYRLVRAPLMARLLSAALLTGIGDLLSGEGIGFSRFTGDFVLEDGVMRTDLLRAYGPGLGITIKGKADFDKDTVDVGGTLVPAYTVNRILGSIPILGPILTGGEGGGVIGVVYSMRGPLDEPEISVNPLSALAPGFLRGLFEVQGEGGEDDGENRFVPQAYPEGHDR